MVSRSAGIKQKDPGSTIASAHLSLQNVVDGHCLVIDFHAQLMKVKMAHVAAHLKVEIIMVVRQLVQRALGISSVSCPTTWDFGPRLDHESGTGL